MKNVISIFYADFFLSERSPQPHKHHFLFVVYLMGTLQVKCRKQCKQTILCNQLISKKNMYHYINVKSPISTHCGSNQPAGYYPSIFIKTVTCSILPLLLSGKFYCPISFLLYHIFYFNVYKLLFKYMFINIFVYQKLILK